MRLPLPDNFRLRQLVTPLRPLGVVARDMILRGLATEKGAPPREPPPLEVTESVSELVKRLGSP